MEMITVKAAANKWNVSERRVQKLCTDGRIKGAHKVGPLWMIPSTAVLPTLNKNNEPTLPMPRKTPFLDMTNIYSEKGREETRTVRFRNELNAEVKRKQSFG